MWPFRRKPKEKKRPRILRRVIVGLVIGGAIGSIVGKKLIDEKREKNGNSEDELEEDEE